MIKIITDSTCSLPEDIITSNDIRVVPVAIVMNGNTYLSEKEISNDEFYSKLPSLKEVPSVIEPSSELFIKVFEEEIANGFTELLVITTSSSSGQVYEYAMTAKGMYFNNSNAKDVSIHVIDSKNIGPGTGYIVMKIAEMKEEGVSATEIIENIKTYIRRNRLFISLTDLNNLAKSGRMPVPAAFIGKLMNISPILTINNGIGEIIEKLRGRKNINKYFIDEFKKRVDETMTDYVIIGYTSDISLANELKEELIKETGLSKRVYIMRLSAPVGVYSGIDALGLYFIEK